MKVTSISIRHTGAELALHEEPDKFMDEGGRHSVRIKLPDGREFRYLDPTGQRTQNVVTLHSRDGVWGAEHGFIPTVGCISSECDNFYNDEPEFSTRGEALASGLKRARELGIPLVEATWPEKRGDGPVYTCLFQPLQVVITDRLGEVVFTARDGALEPVCEDMLPDVQILHEVIVKDGMDPVVINGIVADAWGAPCDVVVRPMPILNPAVKGVRA